MKHVLAIVLSLFPLLATAHAAPFGHAHAPVDGALPAIGVVLLLAIGAGLWAAWRRR